MVNLPIIKLINAEKSKSDIIQQKGYENFVPLARID